MALNPYKSPNNEQNRSRSSSCSSPVRNRVVCHQIFSVGSNTLVRSYSCDQVFAKDSSGRPFQTTKIQLSSYITPEKMTRRRVNSTGARRLMDESSVKLHNQENDYFYTTMFLGILCAAGGIYFFLKFKECNYIWDLPKTELELKNNVFGQSEAIERINSALKSTYMESDDLHVIIFTGGVGVGKTLSSSIIRRNFPWTSNQHLTYSEDFPSEAEKISKKVLFSCGVNLITIDDLTVAGTNEAIKFISALNTNRKMKSLLMILIFNSQTEEQRNEILKQFTNSNYKVYHIFFKPLTKSVVEKCYKREMKRLGVKLSKGRLEKLVEEKMKIVDVVLGPTGCKGVAEEVGSFYSKSE